MTKEEAYAAWRAADNRYRKALRAFALALRSGAETVEREESELNAAQYARRVALARLRRAE